MLDIRDGEDLPLDFVMSTFFSPYSVDGDNHPGFLDSIRLLLPGGEDFDLAAGLCLP